LPSQIPGTFLVKSGIGTGIITGKIMTVLSNGNVVFQIGPNPPAMAGGDSGSPMFKPLVNGMADVYGILTNASGPVYQSWNDIKQN
jgi:hypothetical protein